MADMTSYPIVLDESQILCGNFLLQDKERKGREREEKVKKKKREEKNLKSRWQEKESRVGRK